jgi:GDP-D-mannose 3', 5'-epimerase
MVFDSNWLKMHKILVTGGAGMIGSNLVKQLVSEGNEVSVIDNLWRGRLENLSQNGESVIDISRNFHQIDLADSNKIEQVTRLVQASDYVYHLADIVAGIDYVFANQGDIFRQNMLINSNVIAAVRKSKVKGYVYVGTACSFPAHMQFGADAPPLKEEDQYPAAPESAYGWSKLMGEYEALLMEKETKIPVSILSLHNVYGSPCVTGKTSQVIPAIISKALQWPDEAFTVWGSGKQGRAFVHVSDVVRALILTKTKGLGQGVIQIGPDCCTTIKELAETIVEISGKKITIEFDVTKPEGDGGRCADYSKAMNILGWRPSIELKDGLRETYEWIQRENVLRTDS